MTDAGIDKNEAKAEVKILLEALFGCTEEDKIKGRVLKDTELDILKEKIEYRIKEHMPIQYITGRAWFMGEYFKVTPDVLIPRDETELLVREAIRIIKEYNLKTVLDIGTGSGCIACTIAKQTGVHVLGTDISSDALRIALDNVTELNINNKAVFRKSDLFEKIRSEEKFDLIVSNPPYIPYDTELQSEVLREPKIALFAKDNGLEFYKKIIDSAPKHLNNGGFICFELGEKQSAEVKGMLVKSFENIKIYKDLAGIDRVILGRFVK